MSIVQIYSRNRYLRLISDAFGKNFMGIVQQVLSSAKLVCRQIKKGVSIDILYVTRFLNLRYLGGTRQRLYAAICHTKNKRLSCQKGTQKLY